jgi:hypothetical protein
MEPFTSPHQQQAQAERDRLITTFAEQVKALDFNTILQLERTEVVLDYHGTIGLYDKHDGDMTLILKEDMDRLINWLQKAKTINP